MKKDFGRIGVILGGPSEERDISIKSGRAVYDALISLGMEAVCIDPVDPASVKDQILNSGIDIAFIALHGTFGEDGIIQSILNEMGLPFTGSGPEASRLAMDKAASKKIFQASGIPVPRWRSSQSRSGAISIARGFDLPLVVKPASQGSSIGLSIVEKKEEIESAIDMAFLHDDEVLIEEYIPGKDITVGILGEEPLPVIQIKPRDRFYSFKAKYTDGMSEYIIPADFKEEIKQEAQRLGKLAHRALGCQAFSRVDMLIDDRDDSIFVLELNTIPGLTPLSLLPMAAQAVGVDFPQMCIRMVESALVRV
ncbi:MAG: D-alanine--D-alanine ligase [Candidatus Omnitrophica bacterium]|nr:D-alanine--D-alanine ligase [Candidatus Omnitrophota bacterium]